MDADYGQAQLQRPVYDQEPQQGLGSGVEEKPKMPVLKKVKEKMKAPVKKLKHSIAKKRNHGDKPGEEDTASPDSNVASPDVAVSPDPEEEEGYEEEEEEHDGDHQVSGGDRGIRDALAGARDEDYQAFNKQDENRNAGAGFGDYQGNFQEDPAAPGSVAPSRHDQQYSFPPTAGEEVDANPSLTSSFQQMSVSDQPEKNEKYEQTQQDDMLPTSEDVVSHSAQPMQEGEQKPREDEQKPPNFGSIGHTGSNSQFSSKPMQEDEHNASYNQFSSEPMAMQEDEQKSLNSDGIQHTGVHNQFSESVQGQKPLSSASTEHGKIQGDSATPAASQEEGTYIELPTQEHNPSDSSPNENSNNLSYTQKIGAAAAGLASTVATAGTVLKEKVAPSSSPRGQQQSGKQLDQSGQHLSSQSADQAQQQPGYTQKVYAAIQPAKERAAALASTVYEKAAGAGAVAKEKAAGAGAVAKEKAAGAGAVTKEKAAGAGAVTKEKAAGAGAVAKEKAAGAGAVTKEKAAGAGAVTKEKAAGAGALAKEKAAGAGVLAKEKAAEFGALAKEKAAGARAQAGQMGAGVKNTIAEKLKPGEEEKALSEVIAEMISSRKDSAKENASEAKDIGAEKAAEAKAKAYEAGNIGAEKAKEQTGVAREKANEFKDVGTEKAKEKAAHAREGTDGDGTPVVEKIKGAVTSMFGSRASVDTENAAEKSSHESNEHQLQGGTNNGGTPAVEKIKGAVTSLFGSSAHTDTYTEGAGDQSVHASAYGKQQKDGTNDVRTSDVEKTTNSGTPTVEKIKGAVTSLFGTRAPADAQMEAAGDPSTQEGIEGKRLQEQSV